MGNFSETIKGEKLTYILVGEYANSNGKKFFKNFGHPDDVIEYISNMSRGDNKVHGIHSMDTEGFVLSLTVGFLEGRLALIIK